MRLNRRGRRWAQRLEGALRALRSPVQPQPHALSGGVAVVGGSLSQPPYPTAGVSVRDLGFSFQSLAPGGALNTLEGGRAAAAAVQTMSQASAAMASNGRTFENWSWPRSVTPQAPILTVVSNRNLRSAVSLAAYYGDGVVGQAVNMLAELPLNRGFDLFVEWPSDELPPWIPESYLEAATLVDEDGELRVRQVVADFVVQRCADLSERLAFPTYLLDVQREALLHGDGYLYRIDQIDDLTYLTDFSREHTENSIVDLQGLNPTAVDLDVDEYGVLKEATIVGATLTERRPLDLDRLFHVKHEGSSYSVYGVPVTLRAFKDVEVKKAFTNAAQAWGERYALPIRLLKYGVLVRAGDNSGPVATDSMLAQAQEAIASYDPMSGHTIVAPFHWDYQFVGAEGSSAMNISTELKEANNRLLADLGLPASFLFGDWSNYATARLQHTALLHRLKGGQEQLRHYAERFFAFYCQIRGYVLPDGQHLVPQVRWRRAHLEDDQSMHDFMADIAKEDDILSRQTIRETLGFENKVEEERLARELDLKQERQRVRLELKQELAPPPLPGQPGGPPLPGQTGQEPPAALPEAAVLQRGLRRALGKLDEILAEEATRVSRAVAARSPVALQMARLAELRVARQSRVVAAYQQRMAALGETASAAVMLMLPLEVGEAVAVPGGEPGWQLHVTLAYLQETPRTRAQMDVLRRIVIEFAAATPAVAVELGRGGRFPATVADPRECVWLSATSPVLRVVRQRLVQALQAAGLEPDRVEGYLPHVTVEYVPPGRPAHPVSLPEGPVTCAQVVLSVHGWEQDVWEMYTLSGERTHAGSTWSAEVSGGTPKVNV